MNVCVPRYVKLFSFVFAHSCIGPNKLNNYVVEVTDTRLRL